MPRLRQLRPRRQAAPLVRTWLDAYGVRHLDILENQHIAGEIFRFGVAILRAVYRTRQ